jgi:hypothetical protein
MSRVGVALACFAFVFAIGFEIWINTGHPLPFNDATPYAQWSLSGLSIALVTLVPSILGKGWVRWVVFGSALASAYFWICVAESF